MQKVLIACLLAAATLTGCSKKSSQPKDAVEQKLQEISGSGAKNCGRVANNSDMKAASDCAMQASGAKQPFYVAYDLPGMTVGVAGSKDGKLYSVQAQSGEAPQNASAGAGNAAQVTSAECPAALRVAQSGRVTCMSPGMGMGGMGMGGMGGGNPHGGMSMPPASGENPHGGGMTMPPAGTPNPHGGNAAPSAKPPVEKSSSR